jgi:hypothetical protein
MSGRTKGTRNHLACFGWEIREKSSQIIIILPNNISTHLLIYISGFPAECYLADTIDSGAAKFLACSFPYMPLFYDCPQGYIHAPK